MTRKTCFYVRNALSVALILFLSIGLLVWAAHEASFYSNGALSLVLGLVGGVVSIAIELVIAKRNNTLFIRNKELVARRQASNKQLARQLFAPMVAVGITFEYFPGLIKVVLLALGGGYLLPLSLFLVVHFLKHHKEIERLTRPN